MKSIISSVGADTAVALLQPEVVEKLRFFRNMDMAEEVFDLLWDTSDAVDLVVIDKSDFRVADLYATSRNRAQTNFIIVGNIERGPECQPTNVTFLGSLHELYQNAISALR